MMISKTAPYIQMEGQPAGHLSITPHLMTHHLLPHAMSTIRMLMHIVIVQQGL